MKDHYQLRHELPIVKFTNAEHILYLSTTSDPRKSAYTH